MPVFTGVPNNMPAMALKMRFMGKNTVNKPVSANLCAYFCRHQQQIRRPRLSALKAIGDVQSLIKVGGIRAIFEYICISQITTQQRGEVGHKAATVCAGFPIWGSPFKVS
jgi:hypothetical protein